MEAEPLIQSEEIPQDEVDEEVQHVLEGNFSERVAEHPLENLDIDRLLVERLGEFGWYQKVKSHHFYSDKNPSYPRRSATCWCVCRLP